MVGRPQRYSAWPERISGTWPIGGLGPAYRCPVSHSRRTACRPLPEGCRDGGCTDVFGRISHQAPWCDRVRTYLYGGNPCAVVPGPDPFSRCRSPAGNGGPPAPPTFEGTQTP